MSEGGFRILRKPDVFRILGSAIFALSDQQVTVPLAAGFFEGAINAGSAEAPTLTYPVRAIIKGY